MNKVTKILILTGIGLICIGMLIAAFNFQTLFKPFYNESEFDKKEYYVEADLSKLVVDTDNEAVRIIPYEGKSLKITYFEDKDNEYIITENSDIVTLKKKEVINFFYFSFNFNFKMPDILIEVPADLKLAYDIKSDNSKIELANITISDSVFKTSNGSMSFASVEADNLNCKTSNGRIKLNNTAAAKVNLKTSNGGIHLVNVNADSVIATTSNGKIELSNLASPLIDLKNSNGRIYGTIVGDETDYQKQLSTSNGKITIDGYEYEKNVNELHPASNMLKAKTSNGSINIDFK